MARKFDAEAHIVDLNTMRAQLAKTPFTSDTIREGFKSCGIPSNALFWAVFSNSGLVQKIGEDLYCFRNPDKPIHFHRLGDIYKEYKKRVTIYHNKWYNKKKRRDILKRLDIQDAIKLLQDNGFTIVIDVKNIGMLHLVSKDNIMKVFDLHQFANFNMIEFCNFQYNIIFALQFYKREQNNYAGIV